MIMTEEEWSKTFDEDFMPTGLTQLINEYKQIVKLAKSNRDKYGNSAMSTKSQLEASVLHWLMLLDNSTISYGKQPIR